MKLRAAPIVAAVFAAGLLHAAAGRYLAGVDPIAALLGRQRAIAVAAAIGVASARLFLYFIAPAWAALFAGRCVARAIAAARSPR